MLSKPARGREAWYGGVGQSKTLGRHWEALDTPRLDAEVLEVSQAVQKCLRAISNRDGAGSKAFLHQRISER